MPTTTRPRLTRDERRANFLDMAAELIVAHGVEGVTMEGIAARAGVNKALPYRYFANRDAVLVALFDREAETFDSQVAEVVATDPTFEGKLRAIVGIWLDQVADGTNNVTGALDLARTSDGALEARRAMRLAEVVRYFTTDLVAEYGLTVDDALLVSSVLLAGSQALTVLWQVGGSPREELIDRYLDLCQGAIGAFVAAR